MIFVDVRILEKIAMEERRKLALHLFKGQVNSKSQKSKDVIKIQSGQRCEERSKVVNFDLLNNYGDHPILLGAATSRG